MSEKRLPTDPTRVVRAVILSVEPRKIQADMILAIGMIETSQFTSPAFLITNSISNRHAGSGRGHWTGRVYDTMSGKSYPSVQHRFRDPAATGEDLRIYEDVAQSVRDFLHLLQDPLYRNASVYYESGLYWEFFKALVHGNGDVGYMGAVDNLKTQAYSSAAQYYYEVLV